MPGYIDFMLDRSLFLGDIIMYFSPCEVINNYQGLTAMDLHVPDAGTLFMNIETLETCF